MRVSGQLLEDMVSHALEEPENEVCGVVATRSGGLSEAIRVYQATNVYASPLRFQISSEELLRLWKACEAIGELGAVYHSHVHSRPYPSQTDINFAAGWPGIEWVIIGLADPAKPEVRSYLIENGKVEEVPLDVE